MAITRAGDQIGILGLYVTEAPSGKASGAKQESLKNSIWFRLGKIILFSYRAMTSNEVS